MGCTASGPEKPSQVQVKRGNSAPGKPGNTRRRNSVSAEADSAGDANFKRKVVPKSQTQRSFLTQAMSGIFLFQGVTPKQLDEVIDAMERKEVKANDRLMVQGGDGDFFYVVESGNFAVIKDGQRVHEYQGQGFFGELALMYNTKRAATIECTKSGVTWALDRQSFRRILTLSAQKRVKVSEDSLARVDVLRSVSKSDRAKLADALNSADFADGEVVIQQGAYGDLMYIIEEGAAKTFINSKEGGVTKRREVNRHVVGDYFGERALIKNEPRAATVVADGPLRVWTIDRSAFERLLGSNVKHQMSQRISTYQ
mmetsp:Transcript_2015/g.5754  ORF Transcript_2015/g.5754 Transcript_2015/m.5754 type:complete len:312 (+) Transcript_2015:65-1000(+)